MNAVMAHHEVVVTNPAAEAAGVTIGRQTDVWMPLLSATFATGSRMAVEMAPVWKLRDGGRREGAPARVAVRVRGLISAEIS
jgi:hypothetical protein